MSSSFLPSNGPKALQVEQGIFMLQVGQFATLRSVRCKPVASRSRCARSAVRMAEISRERECFKALSNANEVILILCCKGSGKPSQTSR